MNEIPTDLDMNKARSIIFQYIEKCESIAELKCLNNILQDYIQRSIRRIVKLEDREKNPKVGEI